MWRGLSEGYFPAPAQPVRDRIRAERRMRFMALLLGVAFPCRNGVALWKKAD
jgi:hypothetical protein